MYIYIYIYIYGCVCVSVDIDRVDDPPDPGNLGNGFPEKGSLRVPDPTLNAIKGGGVIVSIWGHGRHARAGCRCMRIYIISLEPKQHRKNEEAPMSAAAVNVVSAGLGGGE